MQQVNKLLDKAREACSLHSDAALAERLQVSRQLVSQWRKGAAPIPDERIANIARMAHADPAEWLVSIRAEQTSGEAAKAWNALAKKMRSAAAVVVLAAVLPALPTTARAGQFGVHTQPREVVGTGCIMRTFHWMDRTLRLASSMA